MNGLRELLREDADRIEIPAFDAGAVVTAGERRLRRRRTAAVVGVVATVALVTVGGVVATGQQDRSQQPIDHPSKHDDDAPTPASPDRPLVWFDESTELSPGDDTPDFRIDVLHVGDRVVETGQVLHSVQFWSMYPVDGGAVYADDDRTVWFTDGGKPRRIASHACVISAGSGLGMAVSNEGSLAAWFDCAKGARGDLVVYDTRADREVARRSVPACRAVAEAMSLPSTRSSCLPDAILGQQVYLARRTAHDIRVDIDTGEVERVGTATYLDDLRTQTRMLTIGDTWRTSTPVDVTTFGEVSFLPAGRRLVPARAGEHLWSFEAGGERTRAFTTRGEPVSFRLPAGYDPPPVDVGIFYLAFEWLDDDTVALAQGGQSAVGDVLTCHVSTGTCRLAVRAAGVVPGLPLPG